VDTAWRCQFSIQLTKYLLMIVSNILFLAFLFRSLIYYENKQVRLQREQAFANSRPHKFTSTSFCCLYSHVSKDRRKRCLVVIIAESLPELGYGGRPFSPSLQEKPRQIGDSGAHLLNSTTDMLLVRQKRPPNWISEQKRYGRTWNLAPIGRSLLTSSDVICLTQARSHDGTVTALSQLSSLSRAVHLEV